MADESKTLWGVRAGRSDEASQLFAQQGVIALGWEKTGDLAALPKDREAFRAHFLQSYPNAKPGAVPVQAGQLFRFLYEMHENDLVIYPAKDQRVYIGRIIGPYQYSTDHNEHYPNRREVRWLGDYPRSLFSQAALYEIGSALTLFQVSNYAHEFLQALGGQPPSEATSADDEETAEIAENYELNAIAYVLRRLTTQLKGHAFEYFVADLLRTMGYRTRISPTGPDGGIDIFAHRDELGFEPPIIVVEVKSREKSVGREDLQKLHSRCHRPGLFGLFVTLSSFHPNAVEYARNNSDKLRLIDGPELARLIFAHYDELDQAYRALIPLKRIYVPGPVQEVAE